MTRGRYPTYLVALAALGAILLLGGMAVSLSRQLWLPAILLGAASLVVGWTAIDLRSTIECDDAGLRRHGWFGRLGIPWSDVAPDRCCLAPGVPLVVVSKLGSAISLPRRSPGHLALVAAIASRIERVAGAPKDLWPCLRGDPLVRALALFLVVCAGIAAPLLGQSRSDPVVSMLGSRGRETTGTVLMREETPDRAYVVTYVYSDSAGHRHIGQDRGPEPVGGEIAVLHDPEHADRSLMAASVERDRARRRTAWVLLGALGASAVPAFAFLIIRVRGYIAARRISSEIR